jgi:hypothetical protein
VRPRQARYQAALRPDRETALFILKYFPTFLIRVVIFGLTVPNTFTGIVAVPESSVISLAWRFIFSKASRFICNFICEYFLKTFASPCRRSCVTHSSATQARACRFDNIFFYRLSENICSALVRLSQLYLRNRRVVRTFAALELRV